MDLVDLFTFALCAVLVLGLICLLWIFVTSAGAILSSPSFWYIVTLVVCLLLVAVAR